MNSEHRPDRPAEPPNTLTRESTDPRRENIRSDNLMCSYSSSGPRSRYISLPGIDSTQHCLVSQNVIPVQIVFCLLRGTAPIQSSEEPLQTAADCMEPSGVLILNTWLVKGGIRCNSSWCLCSSVCVTPFA